MPVNAAELAGQGAQCSIEADSPESRTGPADSPALSEPATETHFRDGRVEVRRAMLAEEVPVAFEYNGVSHAVMLATPGDLEDFALGFSVSEGIVDGPSEIYGVETHRSA